MEYTQVVGKHVKVKIIAKLREQRKFFFFCKHDWAFTLQLVRKGEQVNKPYILCV